MAARSRPPHDRDHRPEAGCSGLRLRLVLRERGTLGRAARPRPDRGPTRSGERLLAALRALPVRQRQAVVLRYLEDLSTAETAGLMGCTQGTVKRAAHDSLRALRSTLTEHAKR
ncbi:sigma-70 family RNA polymerase sigma factor [Nocardioides sp. zg-536]|uniref:Sigma-70 family RNA polymerase sigma factor n=1 Tax=Nocardioides faecalis TaxID=2803858 RepID=A0A938YAC6_9ACTN|nr:sigma-70 family RNA polymerase sigma factor [Nocardioides faecalis]QVI60672.1 sigma-70 family RNA polymerase sigma factor [Nocardioides faecalis]